jgi:hypothetical protein
MLAQRVPYITATCLSYLADEEIGFVKPDSSPAVYAANLDEQLQKHRFLQYAVLNLWTHFLQADNAPLSPESDSSKLSASLAAFFDNEVNIVRWLQLYQLLGGATKKRSIEVFHPDSDLFASLKQYPSFQRLGPTNSDMFVRWDRWVLKTPLTAVTAHPLRLQLFSTSQTS